MSILPIDVCLIICSYAHPIHPCSDMIKNYVRNATVDYSDYDDYDLEYDYEYSYKYHYSY